MILPVYAVGVAGAFLQIAGAQWDISAHILGIVETFFTPAHTVLYTGIALVALASFYGLLLQSKKVGNGSLSHSLFIGMILGGVGMTLGSIRLLRAQRAGQELTNRPRLVPAIVILAIAAVWAQLNLFD